MTVTSSDDDLVIVNDLLKKFGMSASWRGWELAVFKPSPEAAYSPQGVFNNGTYGFETLIEPNEEGHWVID